MTPKELAKRLRRGEQWELAMPFPTDQERERFEAHYGIKWTEIQTLPISSGTRIHSENAYKRHAATWMAAKAAQGGVTEAMVERYKVLHQEGMDRHVESERAAGRTPQLQSAIDAGIRHALAALSAEPAAQGEEGFDARKYVRHMADVLEAGGDLFKVDADLLRLAAAINKAWEQRKRKQPAERVPEGWMLVPIKPTQAMIDAMEACEYPLNAWDEALAATPAAPAEEGDGKEGVR